MRIRRRWLGLALAALAATSVPAFAAAGHALEPLMISEATPEATPGNVLEFSGEVISIGPEAWVVGDQTFVVTPETEIEHDPQVGDFVEVHAVQNSDGSFTAIEIEREDDLEDSDDGEVDESEEDGLDDDDSEDGEHEDLDEDEDDEDEDHEDDLDDDGDDDDADEDDESGEQDDD